MNIQYLFVKKCPWYKSCVYYSQGDTKELKIYSDMLNKNRAGVHKFDHPQTQALSFYGQVWTFDIIFFLKINLVHKEILLLIG